MKILSICAFFIMGLLGSTEWFGFSPDTAYQTATEKVCRFQCSSSGNHTIVLVIKDTSHIVIRSCKEYKIMLQGQEVKAYTVADKELQPLNKDYISIDLLIKQPDNTILTVLSSILGEEHCQRHLPRKLQIFLAKENAD